jgi:uncharacterized repeat protein (TIGR01451 family)
MRRIVLVILGFCAFFAAPAQAQNTISTVAGSPPPNNVAPTAASLEGPVDVVRDGAGNLLVLTDSGVIYKVTPGPAAPSLLTIYAGNNHAGLATSGVPATSALTNEPDSGAFDANGNFYFSDGGNCVIREIVTATGIINTVVGNGTCGFSGNSGPATAAELNFPQGIAIDPSGNLFIADINNNVIRRVDATTKVITTYAGTGATGSTGDGGPASQATFEFPQGVGTDTNGNLFIVDSGNNKIRMVDVGTQVITTVVGTGVFNYTGDGGLATAATMQAPGGVIVDSAGNLYIADSGNAVIRKVTAATGIITTIVGNHGFGFGGDGGPALSATLTNPFGLALDPATGNLWIADYQNNRIRLYTPGNGQISTAVGNGLVGDGGPATSASLYDPRSPALDAQGNLYIVDTSNSRIREVNATTQVISTLVGNGIPCPQPQETCGDNGPATSASISVPRTVTVEPSGTLLVADSGDQRIRQVVDGTITTIAGTGAQCGNPTPLPCGDGGPATEASLNDPRGIVVDSNGNIFFVDAQDNRVRRIDVTTKNISTVAGNGPNGNAALCVPGSAENISGDGGPAVNAILNCPLGLDIDAHDNLFVSDTQNNRVREINATTQIITTVAGSGTTAGFGGDNGPATSATLNNPNRISVNGAENFFVSDTDNNRIRRVDGTSGIITTFVGNGAFAFAGDGGPALSASLANPTGVVVDNQGDMFVGDLFNNRIRLVLLNPAVSFSSNPLAFGNRPISATATLPVTLTNNGDAPLTISNISISAGTFTIAANPCPTTLAVGANCVLQVAFAPTAFVASTGTITVTDNAKPATQAIALSGMGAASLTVTSTGTGTVTSAPAGITCPGTCTATFAGNSQVILTAAAGANFTFANFSTNCAPTAALTCTVTMSADETVTATFTSTNGPSPALTITKSHTGNFTQGQHSAQYTVTVSNAANAAASSGTVTVTDTTLTAVAQDIATSFSGTANPNGVWSYGQYVEAPPAFSLLTGQDAGFPTCGLPYWSDAAYPDVIANNSGLTVSCGTVTVPTDMLWLHPTNTGGTDAAVRWTAPVSGTYEITGSYSALDSTSTTDSILVNGTSVFSTFICNPGNGKTCDTVNTRAPFSVVETLTAGSTVDFTVNCCTLPGQTFLFDSTGLTGAIDSNLSGLSLAAMFGPGWTCGLPSNAANVCTRSDALAPGASYPPITVLANVGVNAPSPQINTVTLSGGGSAPNSSSDSAVINPFGPPLLAIAKSHIGNFTQGQQNATYSVVVSNGANAGPTNGTAVTVTEAPPAALTLVSMAGTGWTCATTTCTRTDALAAGASYPTIAVTVNVAANATSPQVNAVSASGGGSATASATDSTVVNVAGAPALSITKTHAGNFTQGQQNAAYTVTVSNAAGAAPTTGAVTVTETAPSGLTLVGMAGTGWTCAATTCTRADALAAGASYPAIAVTVNVAANATSPQINAVAVSGGGSAAANTTDSTIITNTAAPVLSITKTHTGNFNQGQQNATYVVTVSNGANAGPTTGTVTVTDTVPSGLTFISATGTGWTCVANSCTRADALAAGASYPAITVTVNVASNATSPQVNAVSVSGGGSAGANAMDSTTITQGLVTVTIPSGGSTSATTTPGGTAFYGLVLTGEPGVTGTVQLGCVPSSALITCTVVPSSVTLNGGTTEVAFGITTFCQGATTTGGATLPFNFGGKFGWPLFLLAFAGMLWILQRNRRLAVAFATIFLITLGSAACASLPKGPAGATPAGTYTLTLSTTINSSTQTYPNFLTLVVK